MNRANPSVRSLGVTIIIFLLPAIAFAQGTSDAIALAPSGLLLLRLSSLPALISVFAATLVALYWAMRDKKIPIRTFAKALGIYLSYMAAVTISVAIGLLVLKVAQEVYIAAALLPLVFGTMLGLFFWGWRKEIQWQRLISWPLFSLFQMLLFIAYAMAGYE